ncbi:Aldo/keto reductase [Agrocybe pediades]|nr:Aldo/keto reductase [Agrocybe pediades]
MPQLPTRKIGKDDVTAIGFGLMGLSAFYGAIESDEERFKVLDAAVELGCTNWDSSDIYGDSEDLLGKWFKRTGKRNEIFLATKFGITPNGPNGKPEYVRSAVEKSLKRLGIDQIDLYYLHRADQTTPIEVTVGAMAELVKEGKVRYLGLSEVSSATLRRAHAVHPIAAVQVEYSPICLDIEDDKIALLKTCRELGVAVVAYSPVGRGMLTGTYKSHDDIPKDDWRSKVPKFGPANFPNILKLADGLAEVGKKHNATASQIALAWLLAQGNDIIPIPGTKKIKYLKENIGALHIKLDDAEVAAIREMSNKADVNNGDRYPPESMALLFADTPELQAK